MHPTPHTDIRPSHIIYRHTPTAWHPYLMLMRLDRPVGIWLLLLPCLFSVAMASHGFAGVIGHYPLHHILYFIVGAVLMRGAGCVINDLWDRDIDAQMERTRGRPLASGAVTRKQALIFLSGLLAVSALILLQLPSMAQILGVIVLIPVTLYPLMKRITWWPQAFLGLTFNWGILMGWADATNTLPFAALILYAATLCWTIGYDTIYAHQDIEDDARIGIKSTARLFGRHSFTIVCGFYFAAIVLLTLAKAMTTASLWFLPVVLLAGAHTVHILMTWKKDPSPQNALKTFKRNVPLGLVFLGLCLMP